MSQTDPLEPAKTSLSAPSLEKQHKRLTDAALTRRTAWLLSLAGAIPFLALSFAVFGLEKIHPLHGLAQDALKTYGAVILSFLGGIRWGLAMRSQDPETGRNVFVLAVIPSLVGWFAIFLPVPYVYGILALGFAAQGAWDSFAAQNGVFGLWFAKLRMTITAIVVACMVIAFFGTV
ncbi:DUF3429 domain-containing protein [Pseudahrensia aquimaris]|uniref:DUF3429 domain-containing protein n=1 Tax=Pseudahrensia aquimaris TaxID=744461 RepID=A0ABW3FM51_9HYPH